MSSFILPYLETGTTAVSERDFNNVKVWLNGKLAERKISLSDFVVEAGLGITNATIFRWYNDTFRPTPEKMDIVCKTLSNLPILEEGRQPRFEHVPLREGLAQFTERARSY